MRSLILAVHAALFAHASVANPVPDWSYYPGYFLPGQNGIVAADLDADGRDEAVISGSAQGGFQSSSQLFLAILEAAESGFRTVSLTNLDDPEFFLGTIQVLPGPSGAPDQIVASVHRTDTQETDLVTWSGKPLRVVTRVRAPSEFQLMQVADIDADGVVEALGLVGNFNALQAVVLSLPTGAVEWSDTLSSSFVAAGQLDNDAALEIVIGGSGPGRILDGASRTLQWSYPDGFRGYPVFGNFRGSANDREFAVVEPWGVTRVFVSTPIFSPVFEIATGETSRPVVVDIDANGVDDLGIGEGQWGNVSVYSTVSGLMLRTWSNPEHGVSALAFGEMDATPGLEVVYGAGLSSSGEDIVRVLDTNNGEQRYLREDEGGPHSSGLLIDIEGNGSEEFMFATSQSRSGYSGSNLRVLNAVTGVELNNRMSVLDPWGSEYGVTMRALQMDSDPGLEIAVASGRTYDGEIAVIDGLTLLDQWRVQPQGFRYIDSIELLRFNEDGVDDIVAAGSGRVVILDGVSGAELFRSISFQGSGLNQIAVGQTDSDPQLEIILSVGTNAYIIDPLRGLIEGYLTSISDMHGLRVEMAGGECLVVVTLNDRLERRRCNDGALDSQRLFGLDALWAGIPVDSFGPLVLSDGKYLHRLQGSTLSARSAVLGQGMGARNRGVARMDGDNIVVWVGGAQAVHRVTLPMETELFADGFE
jgi:hypothetical protein